jgi:flagellin
MASTINTNINSLTAQRNLGTSQASLANSMQRLSSGLRINSAKDDAAGLAISERMTSQIRGLNQAARNANDAISLTQTAEGALGGIASNLQRMRELAVQAANGTNSASDRSALQAEVLQLGSEVNRVATTTQFNGLNLLDGTLSAASFQVGANANQTINVAVASAQGKDLGNNTVTASKVAGSLSTFSQTALNNFAAQTLTVSGNGVAVGTGAIAVNSTAKAVAGVVNTLTSQTGVTASATTTATVSGVTAGTVSFDLYGANTTAVAISATVVNATDLSAIAKAVNAQSSVTNITATSDQAGNMVLTDLDGNNVRLTTTQLTGVGMGSGKLAGANNVASAILNGGSATVGGVVSFDSKSGFSVATSAGATLMTALTNGSAISTVSAVDVSTAGGATAALKVIDAALGQISDQRASLGAVQNRFDSTVSNLQTSSENMSASRSRIQDADFAQETANLSRSQILQQAGTAMVAQANQLPQGVLALLR